MNRLPSPILELLIHRVLKETSAAWLLISYDGELINMGGELSVFGLESFDKGCMIQQQAIFLEGILSIQNPPPTIDSIQIDNGQYADLYLIENEEGRWIILLGRTERSRWKGIAQQKANELQLLKQQFTAQSEELKKINFSSLIGVLMLEQNSDGSFRLLEEAPDYFTSIYPDAYTQYDNLHPENDFAFLANFLEDCETVWSAEKEGRLKSGPWVEGELESELYILEATAILCQQRKILLIERLQGDYEEHLAILQLGRENALTKRKLEEEIVRQKIMEQHLIEAKAKADRASQAKSEFLSSMSHELRTPLNAILGFSQLLLSDTAQPLTEEQKESMEYIVSSGGHLLELISQVLELSKIEAGGMDLSVEDVAASEVIESCIPIIQVVADKQNISISWSGRKNAAIRADYLRLKQVILNLLSNAVKYNKPGGTVEVIESLTEQGYFRIAIKDTGIGIPTNKREKLFTAFSRLGQENSGIEGTGVGLVVTKTIVHAMNGAIGFESVEGEGSTFWVEFPISIY